MTPELVEYIAVGKQLTVDERLEVAHQLLLSVQRDDDSAQQSDGAEWEADLLRRANEALDGTALLHDVGQSHAQLRAELAAMRHQ